MGKTKLSYRTADQSRDIKMEFSEVYGLFQGLVYSLAKKYINTNASIV